MVCPRCGQVASVHAGRCTACGAPLAPSSLTGVVTFDATGVLTGDAAGLVPEGTFDARAGLPASDPTAATDAPGTPGTAGTAPTAEVGAVAPGMSGPLNVGQSFGPRYHIIRILGVGGMGAVYQAWDSELGVAVALKVIRADRRRGSALPAAEKRFKNELLLARQVTHKNVVRIHDLGEIDGIKFITMPYVQGDDLATILRRDGKLPIARALHVAREIACGLEAAHEAGVVHRDLKPANIMIGSGDEQHALIMDFGISASADAAADGRIVGTLEYMSPEQGIGGTVDSRSDLYAFGLILHELLVGRRGAVPKTAEERFAAMKQRFEEGVPALRSLDPSIPEPVAAIVARCVQRDPGARYQTTAELSAALAALDEAGELIPVPARISKRVLRVAILFLLVLLAGMYVIGRRFAPVAPPVHEPMSVLIADFDNLTHDPAFNGSLEEALGPSVEGASFVTAYRRDNARKVAAQLLPGSKLDHNAARVVALREGINVVLAGSIEPKGNGYLITVRAIDPAINKVLTTASATASSKRDVLKALGTTASKIRSVLGDTTPESIKLAAAETVTTGSIEALADYSRAQDLLYNSKDEEAITYYKRAIALDPNLGRAYSGWAISAENLGRQEESTEAWRKALSMVDRMTDREKYRTLGIYHVRMSHNYEKAIENFSLLVGAYPNDRGGHVNLALAYFYTRNFSKALEHGRRSIDGAPRDLMNRTNYALYAMYAGDFPTAAAEASVVIKQDAAFYRAYLPLAVAALAQSDFDGARKAYEAMAASGTPGASVATLGLADMALYQGRFKDAEGLLRAGIAEDQRQKNTLGMAAKYTALGEAYLGDGKKALAVTAAERAMKVLGRDVAAVPAALVLIDAGKPEGARALAAYLGAQLQPEWRAYGKVLDGYLARRDGQRVAASESLVAAQKLVDLWTARLELGITYVEAGGHAEALGEFERAQKRRGEATSIMLDDLPTYRYLAPLPYWAARAQDALGQREAALVNYKAYLDLRSQAPGDPLAADARRRVNAQ